MHLLEVSNKTIIFGVLNWGLGHASRSSQVIDQLIRQNNSVQIASSGQALAYLKNKFPSLVLHDLGGNEIIYPAHSQLWFNLLLQSKKIIATIKNEQAFIKKTTANDSSIDLRLNYKRKYRHP